MFGASKESNESKGGHTDPLFDERIVYNLCPVRTCIRMLRFTEAGRWETRITFRKLMDIYRIAAIIVGVVIAALAVYMANYH